jgi:plasmid maintenance system antidote protein VapI
MEKEIEIFNKLNEKYGYSKSEIARMADLERVLISRFLHGHQDISLSRFFKLIKAMPPSFQEAYWIKLLGYNDLKMGDRDWDELIGKADFDDLPKILKAISDRWTKLTESKKELTKV